MEKGFTIENNILRGPEETIKSYSYELGQIFLNKFDETPKHIWQIEVETEKETTFAEMKENTIRCALWMQKQNIGKNDVVAISSPNQRDAYIPCVATFYIGAIYNPWEPNIVLRNARHHMKIVKPKIIFVYKHSDVEVIKEAATLENVKVKIITFEEHPEMEFLKDILRLQTKSEVQTFQYIPIENQKNIAMILFSSGTTGLSKSIAYSYEALSGIIANSKVYFQEGVSLWYATLNWISGTCSLLLSIISSVTRIVHENFEPEETCKIIEKFEVDWVLLHPCFLSSLFKLNVLNVYKLKSLKKIITGGAKVNSKVINHIIKNLPYAQFIQAYGLTEGGLAYCANNEHTSKIESVGFVSANTQLKIIDVSNGTILGPNQPGEICLKHSIMMLGYYKNPKATNKIIEEEGWLQTGDLGYYDQNGEVFIVDRLKAMIKSRKGPVSPSELEAILEGHPDILGAAVVPVADELGIESAMAFLKKSPNSQVSEPDIIKLLSSELGDISKLWGGVRFLEEIPRLATGKINRMHLKEIAKI